MHNLAGKHRAANHKYHPLENKRKFDQRTISCGTCQSQIVCPRQPAPLLPEGRESTTNPPAWRLCGLFCKHQSTSARCNGSWPPNRAQHIRASLWFEFEIQQFAHSAFARWCVDFGSHLAWGWRHNL